MEGNTTEDKMRQRGYVTPRAVAQHTGRSYTAVRAAIDQHKLEFVRMGDGPKARLFVRWASVLAWIGPDAAQALGLAGPGAKGGAA